MIRVLLITCLLALAAGCGSDGAAGSGRLTHDELVSQAGRACQSALDRLTELGAPESEDEADLYMQTLDRAYDRMVEDLEELTPSPEDADTYGRMLDALQKAAPLVDKLVVATQEGDREAATELAPRFDQLNNATRVAASELGIEPCAAASN